MSELDANLIFDDTNITDESEARLGSEEDNQFGFGLTLFEELSSVSEINTNDQSVDNNDGLNGNNCPLVESQTNDNSVDQQWNDITDVIQSDDNQPLDLDDLSEGLEEEDINHLIDLMQIKWNQLIQTNIDSNECLLNTSDDQQMVPIIETTPPDSPINGSDVSMAPKVDCLALAVQQIGGFETPIEIDVNPPNESSFLMRINPNVIDLNVTIQSQESVPSTEPMSVPSVQFNNVRESEETDGTPVRNRSGRRPNKRRGRSSLEEQGMNAKDIKIRRKNQNREAQQRRRDRIKRTANANHLSVATITSTDRLITESQFTAFVDLLEKLRDGNFDGSHICHIDYLLQLTGGLPFVRLQS